MKFFLEKSLSDKMMSSMTWGMRTSHLYWMTCTWMMWQNIWILWWCGRICYVVKILCHVGKFCQKIFLWHGWNIFGNIFFFVHAHKFTITWRGSRNIFTWIDITSTNINIRSHDDGLLAIIAPNCGIIIIMHNVGEVCESTCEQVVWHIKHCPPKSNM